MVGCKQWLASWLGTPRSIRQEKVDRLGQILTTLNTRRLLHAHIVGCRREIGIVTLAHIIAIHDNRGPFKGVAGTTRIDGVAVQKPETRDILTGEQPVVGAVDHLAIDDMDISRRAREEVKRGWAGIGADCRGSRGRECLGRRGSSQYGGGEKASGRDGRELEVEDGHGEG